MLIYTREQLLEMRDNAVEMTLKNMGENLNAAISGQSLLHLRDNEYLGFHQGGWMPVFFEQAFGSVQPILYTVTSVLPGWNKDEVFRHIKHDNSESFETPYLAFIPTFDNDESIDQELGYDKVKRHTYLYSKLSLLGDKAPTLEDMHDLYSNLQEIYGTVR